MPIGGYAALQPVLASAARTTDGNSNWFNVSEYQRITFYIKVTAISGNLTMKIQESPNESDVYDLVTVDSEITINTTGYYKLTTDEHTKYVRINYNVGISATFEINKMGRW